MLKDAHPSATRSAIVGSRRLLTGLLPCAGNFTLKTGRIRSALVRSPTLRNESPARRRCQFRTLGVYDSGRLADQIATLADQSPTARTAAITVALNCPPC